MFPQCPKQGLVLTNESGWTPEDTGCGHLLPFWAPRMERQDQALKTPLPGPPSFLAFVPPFLPVNRISGQLPENLQGPRGLDLLLPAL